MLFVALSIFLIVTHEKARVRRGLVWILLVLMITTHDNATNHIKKYAASEKVK
ncbi:hypothetical protein [Candidatus Moranella endobia]|uniref:hypothetical protein n=1 Tax=Candidatus Moranella endobia TaxID=1048758 RepID=UPI0002E74A23|nr:hypothetical protein [Candidatus Moranella endobia]